MDAQKTGALIAEARREKGLTQKELAQALHVSAQAVSKWERGLNFPDLSLLEPLGDCLGLTVAELLSGQRGEEPKEELLRDSLRLAPAQMGRRLKRWQVLALACLGLLLVLTLGGGFWYVKNCTELLPQRVTTIAPIERSAADQLAFQAAGLPSVSLYELTVADGTDHYQIQMEYWTSEGLVQTWPVLQTWAEDVSLPRRQQMAFSCQPQPEEGKLHVRVNLTGFSGQAVLEDIPNLELGYGISALCELCELDPEHGVVLLCCSLAMEDPPELAKDGEGERAAVYRAPNFVGALEQPDTHSGDRFLLLRLIVN